MQRVARCSCVNLLLQHDFSCSHFDYICFIPSSVSLLFFCLSYSKVLFPIMSSFGACFHTIHSHTVFVLLLSHIHIFKVTADTYHMAPFTLINFVSIFPSFVHILLFLFSTVNILHLQSPPACNHLYSLISCKSH